MIASHKLDTPNCQRWLGPPFAKKLDWANYVAMADETDNATIREHLRRLLEKRGIKWTTLSLSVGTNRTLVKNLLEGTGEIQVGTLIKLAGALDLPLADLLSAPRVQIVGRIGAGGSVLFDEPDIDDTVLRPPSVSGELIALAVAGDSMLPKYKDGDVIYIKREYNGVLPEDVGDDCAVRLTSGETYLKQLMLGSEPGRFTLLSLNAPPMVNVEVVWASPVLFVMSARSRQRLA